MVFIRFVCQTNEVVAGFKQMQEIIGTLVGQNGPTV